MGRALSAGLLCLVGARLASALRRLPPPAEAPEPDCRGGREYREEEAPAAYRKTATPQQGKLYPELSSLLNGTQWCEFGAAPPRLLNGRVALLVIGQAFRARNYHSWKAAMCTEGTEAAQKRVVANHLDTIVSPIEATLGMQVDVFLTDAPCGTELNNWWHSYVKSNVTEFDGIGMLKRWYGPERVKGVNRSGVNADMYHRSANLFQTVDSYMVEAGGTYEYFIVARYDVVLDRPFLSLMPERHQDPAHRGLSFFTYGHDFFFAFPGELWGCMLQMWKRCLASPANHGWRSEQLRRSAGCFDLGPLHLGVWPTGYGYIMLLASIFDSLGDLGRIELLGVKGMRNGTSAFDVHGREHRCIASGDYFPPRGSVESRFMPFNYHVR